MPVFMNIKLIHFMIRYLGSHCDGAKDSSLLLVLRCVVG